MSKLHLLMYPSSFLRMNQKCSTNNMQVAIPTLQSTCTLKSTSAHLFLPHDLTVAFMAQTPLTSRGYIMHFVAAAVTHLFIYLFLSSEYKFHEGKNFIWLIHRCTPVPRQCLPPMAHSINITEGMSKVTVLQLLNVVFGHCC